MPDNDNGPLTLEELEIIEREFQCGRLALEENIDAGMHSMMDKNFIAQAHDAELSYKLETMDISIDQEMWLYNLLTLPDDALELVKERLGITSPSRE